MQRLSAYVSVDRQKEGCGELSVFNGDDESLDSDPSFVEKDFQSAVSSKDPFEVS